MPSMFVASATAATVALLLVVSAAHADAAQLVHPGPTGRSHHFVLQPTAVPHPESDHHVVLALKQSNMDTVKRLVEEVSTPTHPRYGQYLSQSQVTDLVAPPPHAMDAVLDSLATAGASNIEIAANRDVVRATMSVAAAERMFSVKLNTYTHAVHGRTIVRSLAPYTLPRGIAAYVDIVHGVSDFPVAMKKKPHTSEQMLAKGAARQAGLKPTSTAPIVDVALALPTSPTQAAVVFTVICKDGKAATTMPLCQGAGPAPTNITISVATSHTGPSTPVSATMPLNCHSLSGQVQCVAFFKAPEMYTYYQTNLTVTYSDGSDSDMAVNPYPIVRTPTVMPRDLAALYSIPDGAAATNKSLSQAVGEFEQQYYSPADLAMFLKDAGVVSAPVTLIGPNNASLPGGEASLDIQYIMAMGRGVATTFWSIEQPSTAPVDHILEYAYQVNNASNPPVVHSLSYGMAAANVDKYQGTGYVVRSDNELAKLALRGLTIIIASGDAGAGLIGPYPQEVPNCDVFHPDWPSISPYVTAVGSTVITPLSEPACLSPPAQSPPNCLTEPLGEVLLSTDTGMPWTATGGFSFTTATPSYQKDVVEAYLTTYADILPPAHLFNASGRAFPDVVTVGHNLEVVDGGKFVPTDGTSASAPIFAGIVSLLNEARANAGMSPLGFANPLLYHIANQRPGAFRDITVGNNRCSSQGACCEAGFQATVGFDPATGLGSPNYSVLREAVVEYGCSDAQRAAGATC